MLVVGGGLVGLTAALLLRARGVTTVLVEERSSTSPQPKARRLHMRSMEDYRQLGIAELVHDAARDLAGHDHMAAGTTLAEAKQLPLWQPGEPGEPLVVPNPELPCLLSQDLLEPLLRQAAVEAGVEVRFGTELTDLSESDQGIDAQLLAHQTGHRSRLTARYVIAADGARSPIRERLGIARSTNGFVGRRNVNVYFRADLAEVVRGREFNLCQITNPDAPGALASVDGRRRWVFMAPGANTDRDWPTLLRRALGVPAPDLEILSVLAWQSEMRVADRYRAGGVFLAGDAAHVMPPFAANGANTGIADAHNLAWKLAAVLQDQADDGLLDSYDAERRPAGWFAADQSARRTQQIQDRSAPDPTLAHPYVLALGGFQYTAGALIPPADMSDDPEPTTSFERADGSEPESRTAGSIPSTRDQRSTSPDQAGPSSPIKSCPASPARLVVQQCASRGPTASTSSPTTKLSSYARTTSSPGADPTPTRRSTLYSGSSDHDSALTNGRTCSTTHSGRSGIASRGVARGHVVAVVGVLRTRLAEPWSFDALAEEVHLSRSQLVRSFEATVGMSPMAC